MECILLEAYIIDIAFMNFVQLKNILRSNIGTILLLLVVVGTHLYNANASLTFNESFYLHGVFPKLRWAYDNTLGRLPFGVVYLAAPLLFLFIVYHIGTLIYYRNLNSFLKFGKFILYFASTIYLLFYWSWAFNYKNRPLRDHLVLPSIRVDSHMVFDEAMHIMDIIKPLRDNISLDTCALHDIYYPKATEDILRKSLVQILNGWKLPTVGKVRVRTLKPDGILLRFSTAGIYIPFLFEGHIDDGLAYIHRPFVMAHEMAHGYGITDEGDCNFIAVLVCANADDPYIRYSGLLAYWRYLANSLVRVAPNMGN
ncbi:MAG TPA: DUF3810 family protein, partial [Saprospiraceae bacterium]|nr:DUF3810 family protein [Saprospiraceae bacterium]